MSGNEKQRFAKLGPRVVASVLLCCALAVATPGCRWKTQEAKDYVIMAWDVGNVEEIDPELLQRLHEGGVPESLKTPHEIALYLFNKAAELDPERSGAYYNLGLYWLERDCDQSRKSFARQLTYESGAEVEEIVRAFETGGCEAAKRTVSKQL